MVNSSPEQNRMYGSKDQLSSASFFEESSLTIYEKSFIILLLFAWKYSSDASQDWQTKES